MKKNLLKSLVILSVVFSAFYFLVASGSGVARALDCSSDTDRDSAACQCELGDASVCKAYCNDSANSNESQYQSAACLQIRLGLDDIDTDGILIKTHPVTYLIYIFRFFLFIVTIVVVFRNVMAGMTIANAKDDAEKRTEGFKKLMNAAIGLAVALSALGVSEFIKNVFTSRQGDDVLELLSDCESLAARDASPKVVANCEYLRKQYEEITGKKAPVKNTPTVPEVEIPCVPGSPC